jgi:DhnA family fructose-bisphosphate aldolase class Ia
MIMATELGKDPLLRKKIRELFRREGRISVLPTDKGMIKTDIIAITLVPTRIARFHVLTKT